MRRFVLVWGLLAIAMSACSSSVQVPDVVGEEEAFARGVVVGADLTVEIEREESGDTAPGHVIRTIPAAGESVDPESTVVLVVADAPSPQPGGFSAQIRNEFMDGCEPEGGTEFCECTLDELEKVYTEAEFIQVGLEAFASGSDDVPEEMMTAVLNCVQHIPTG